MFCLATTNVIEHHIASCMLKNAKKEVFFFRQKTPEKSYLCKIQFQNKLHDNDILKFPFFYFEELNILLNTRHKIHVREDRCDDN